MMLLTKEIRKTLPKLYSQEKKGENAMAVVKFFTPWTNWTWLVTEGQPDMDEDNKEIDFMFFGLVDGFEQELGYFSLNEIMEVKGPAGLKIERDLYFTPKALKDCRR